MNENLILKRNIFYGIFQMLISGFLMFGLYLYLGRTFSMEDFGIWSTLVATMSIAKISDMGLTASTIRFVAKDLAKNNKQKVMVLINTIILFSTLFILLISFCILPFVDNLIGLLYPNKIFFTTAMSIVPYVFVNLLLTVIYSAHLGALDGAQRIDIRAKLTIIGLLIWVTLSYLLVPKYGLIGLCIAQVAQSIVMLIFSRYLFFKLILNINFFNFRFDYRIITEIFSYSVNLQVSSIFIILFEPLAKSFLTIFSGPAAAGLYEIANQIITRIRALIISGNQAIVPFLITQTEKNFKKSNSFFIQNFKGIFYLAMLLFFVIATMAESFSMLFLNEVNDDFIILVRLLGFANIINLLSVPSYFHNMTDHRVIKNTISHLGNALIFSTFGLIFGNSYGIYGIYLAIFLAICLPSLFILFDFLKANKIRTKELFESEDFVTLCSFILIYLSHISFFDYSLIIECLIYPLLFGIVLYTNKSFRNSLNLVLNPSNS